MNYRDFFKKEAVSAQLKDAPQLSNIDPKELEMGIKVEMEHTTDEPTAKIIASHHLKEDPKYYTHMKSAGLKEDNGGLPKRDGALDIPHLGQPIKMGKVINVGSFGAGSATGVLSGMTSLDSEPSAVSQGVSAPGDKEPITAGGKEADKSMASKSAGGPATPGEGQKQGGPNTKGCIADTPANSKIEGEEAKGGKPGGSLNSAGTIGGTAALGGGCPGAPEAEDVVVDLMEAKEAHGIIQELIGEVLEEIDFDENSGRWINEGGHKAGCTCGFCKNKGKFSKKAKKGEKDDKKEKKNPFADKGKKKEDKKAKGNPFAKGKKDEKDINENRFAAMHPDEPEAQTPSGQAGMIHKTSTICPRCNGSGEGMADGTKCLDCKGSGDVRGWGKPKSLPSRRDPDYDPRDQGVDECFEAGPQYKVAGRQYRTSKDDWARSVAQTPEMTEAEEMGEAAPPGFEPGEKHGHVLMKLKKQYGKDSPKTYATAWAIYNKMQEGAIVQTESGWERRNPDDKIKEGRCEDYPCCGHEAGDCPDRDEAGNETWRCARCRAKLPKGARSSLCDKCTRRMQRVMDDDPTGQDLDNFQEVSYKVVSPTQARGAKCDHARRVQTEPEVTEADIGIDDAGKELPPTVDEPGEKIDTNLYGHKGQKGYVLWVCERCGHELVRNRTSHNRPKPVTWRDGHTCRFVPSPEQPKVTAPSAGAGLAEQSFKKGARSYRTFKDSPQFPEDSVFNPEVSETMSPDDADRAREYAGEYMGEMASQAIETVLRYAKPNETLEGVYSSISSYLEDQGTSVPGNLDQHISEELGLPDGWDEDKPLGQFLAQYQAKKNRSVREEKVLKEVIRSIVKEVLSKKQ